VVDGTILAPPQNCEVFSAKTFCDLQTQSKGVETDCLGASAVFLIKNE
jgi:hypothetical protein